jgi:membrane-bound lytic murein transglycosylase F
VRRLLLFVLFLSACSKREATTPPAVPRPAPPPAAIDTVAKPMDAATPTAPETPLVNRDLAEITESNELRVLFTFNSTGYLVYRGETMGYEYELLRQFTRDRKLRLVPVVVRDSTKLYEMLARGDGDVIAAQLVAGRVSPQIVFTAGLYETAPVVVQRKNAAPTAGMAAAVTTADQREQQATGDIQPLTIHARLVTQPAELAGQQVHLSQASPYRDRLLELNEELTQDIEVVQVDESTDRVIQRLAEGELAYTVAPENLAALKSGEYTNLIIKPAIGPPQQVVWGLRANAPNLRAALDQWIAAKRKAGLLGVLYKKYFNDRRGFVKRAESRYLAAETGTLSQYDDYFREYARIPGWDWRLVASQAYQESRFNANARSWAGAQGVMQIMPRTARELKVNAADPRQSIEGACRYLWKLDQQLKDDIERESERIKFILGAYNVGLGHVEDARRLAKKHGDDEDDWNDVAYWLIRKSKRAVYNDPVVKYGFARGTEPVAYVEQILDRYAHYKQFVVGEPASDAPTP